MEMLTRLKEANPRTPMFSVFDAAFSPFGRVIFADEKASEVPENVPRMDLSDLEKALNETEIPAEGNHYEPSIPALEKTRLLSYLPAYPEKGPQAGYTNGRGDEMNAMEYHRCSEFNYSTTGLVLLLALPEDLHEGRMSADAVRGFYLPKDVVVEVYPMVLHFAPCRVLDSGYRSLVVLERGTNLPVARPDAKKVPFTEDNLLFAANKWLTCHPDSPQAKEGAFIGISGENIRVNTVKSPAETA